jgi:hypothetical protein
MILIFAVLFPLVKLVSIALCTLSPNKWARNKNIYYFAFEASKWDMSNVMVVAILMTFIGFNGIVDSTLSSLNFSLTVPSQAPLRTTRAFSRVISFSSRLWCSGLWFHPRCSRNVTRVCLPPWLILYLHDQCLIKLFPQCLPHPGCDFRSVDLY